MKNGKNGVRPRKEKTGLAERYRRVYMLMYSKSMEDTIRRSEIPRDRKEKKGTPDRSSSFTNRLTCLVAGEPHDPVPLIRFKFQYSNDASGRKT